MKHAKNTPAVEPLHCIAAPPAWQLAEPMLVRLRGADISSSTEATAVFSLVLFSTGDLVLQAGDKYLYLQAPDARGLTDHLLGQVDLHVKTRKEARVQP